MYVGNNNIQVKDVRCKELSFLNFHISILLNNF